MAGTEVGNSYVNIASIFSVFPEMEADLTFEGRFLLYLNGPSGYEKIKAGASLGVEAELPCFNAAGSRTALFEVNV